MSRIKAVIFDLDGTLGNTLPLCIESFRRSLEPLIRRPLLDDEIIAAFGASEEGIVMSLAPDHYEKGIADYLLFYESMHGLYPYAFDGIIPMLHYLKEKRIHIGMVTGKGKRSADITLNRFGISRFFEIIETGDPRGPRKAEGIQKVSDFFGNIAASEIIYVGDAPSDITFSRKAGVRAVAAAWADTAEAEKLAALEPDQLFLSIADFRVWLAGEI